MQLTFRRSTWILTRTVHLVLRGRKVECSSALLRRVRYLLLAVALVMPAVFVTARPAYAAGCSSSNHCYAIWTSFTGNLGTRGKWYVVSASAPSGRFINHETWQGTPGNGYWIEAGYTAGPIAGNTYPGISYFHATNRPSGYTEFYDGDADVHIGQWMSYDLHRTYDNGTLSSWSVWRNGSLRYTYANHQAGAGTGTDTGMETTHDDAVLINGASGYLEFQTIFGVWVSGIPGATVHVSNSSVTGAYYLGMWIDTTT